MHDFIKFRPLLLKCRLSSAPTRTVRYASPRCSVRRGTQRSRGSVAATCSMPIASPPSRIIRMLASQKLRQKTGEGRGRGPTSSITARFADGYTKGCGCSWWLPSISAKMFVFQKLLVFWWILYDVHGQTAMRIETAEKSTCRKLLTNGWRPFRI